MKPEELFGVNAGKVWATLKEAGQPLTARDIAKRSGLKITEVFGALGWLGREGKIEVVEGKRALLFKLLE